MIARLEDEIYVGIYLFRSIELSDSIPLADTVPGSRRGRRHDSCRKLVLSNANVFDCTLGVDLDCY